MNKRIEELAKQAQKVVGYTDGGYTEIKALDQEKFAQLIVRDVLDEVLQAMDDGMDVYDTVADKFGVE